MTRKEPKMKGWLKKAIIILVASFCVGTLVNLRLWAFPGISERFNDIVYDVWMRLSTHREPDPSIVIVDIDDASLKEIGQLPWPRTVLADLVQLLLNYEVKAIGLDIWLSEPDRSSPINVDSQLEKDFGYNLDLSKLPIHTLDNDRYFRDIISKKPVVIGAQAIFDKDEESEGELPEGLELEVSTAAEHPFSKAALKTLYGIMAPLPLFTRAAVTAILNFPLADDGVVRKIPLLTTFNDKVYGALSLLTLMKAEGLEKAALEELESGALILHVGKHVIPLERDGAFRPVYRGMDHAFQYYRAMDILNGKIGEKELAGKTVFLGPTAHTLQRLSSTPLDPDIPRVEIHATLLDNFLQNDSIKVPAHEEATQIALTFFSAITACAAFSLLAFSGYATFAIVALASYIWGSWICFQNELFISPMGPVLALLLAGSIIIPFRYWREFRERRKIQHAFSQYVAPEIVSKILEEGAQVLEGEQIEVTLMFTDVRNFTAISEKLSPFQVVHLLNAYFTAMTACVTKHGGTLDKFIGDALMAFWNAPLNVEKHPLKAVLAALDMQKALKKLQPQLHKDFGIDLYNGIGIHTGTVHVGNMGSNELMNYTCIGETVNLASRLEGLCKYYGVAIIVSDTARNVAAPDVEFLLLDKIQVKGSSRPLLIYTPTALFPDCRPESQKIWLAALDAYFAGKFREALAGFESLLDGDFPQSPITLFIGRCKDLLKNPPLKWTGVWKFTTK